MPNVRFFEIKGRIAYNNEAIQNIKTQISELKEAMISSLNAEFKSFLWRTLADKYEAKQKELKTLQDEVKILQDDLRACDV